MDASDTQRADELFSGQCGPDFEVDDRSHELKRTADARRDRDLGRLGYRVLRVPAELVRRDVAEAVARIVATLTVET